MSEVDRAWRRGMWAWACCGLAWIVDISAWITRWGWLVPVLYVLLLAVIVLMGVWIVSMVRAYR